MIHLQHNALEAHAFKTAKNNNPICGDSFYMTTNDNYFLCVLADGLGSGKFAYEASHAVVSIVKSNPEGNVDRLMHDCNKILGKKRGAAVAILKVDFNLGEFEYSCVGNIRFYVHTPQGKMIYPLPVTGYLCGRPQRFRTQTYTYEPHSNFLIHSDGLVYANIRKLLSSYQSVTELAEQLKEKQVNNSDDMSFIVGSLL